MAEIEVKSEVTGSVWKILTKAGAEVEEDEMLIMLESMKMEIPVTAPEDGTIKSIAVAEGDAVVEGQLVLTLEIE